MSPHASAANDYSDPIVIIGSGIAGLIHAYVLLCDGFKDVTIITKDSTVGGVWVKNKLYPGLKLSNAHGEYRFSALEMPLRQYPNEQNMPDKLDDGRANGDEINAYFEKFYKECLVDRFGDALTMRFDTEVVKVRREGVGKWVVHCSERNRGEEEQVLRFSKLILATGTASEPKMPPSLTPTAAKQSGYNGVVIHSSDYGKRYGDILATVPAANMKADPTNSSSSWEEKEEDEDDDDFVLVAGSGKSAMDVSTHLANEGRKVCMVFGEAISFFGGPTPPPAWLRKSRLITVLSPFSTLDTRLERFLHTTRLGSWVIRKVWNGVESKAIKCAGLPPTHPLRPPGPLFYAFISGDEGVIRPGSFYPHAKEGTLLRGIASTKLVEFTQDGSGVTLDNGRVLKPAAVVLCTGYDNSYTRLFDDELIRELGLEKVPFAPTAERQEEFKKKWDYRTLSDAPPLKAPKGGEDPMLVVHRGIVPVKNLPNRDFAIAGALDGGNLCYVTEAAAHWVSSYFLSDPFLSLPTQEEAFQLAEEKAAWSRRRYPSVYAALFGVAHPSPTWDPYNWTQTTEELLTDLGVEERKSRKGVFWAFGRIGIDDLETLGEERNALRQRHRDTAPS